MINVRIDNGWATVCSLCIILSCLTGSSDGKTEDLTFFRPGRGRAGPKAVQALQCNGVVQSFS